MGGIVFLAGYALSIVSIMFGAKQSVLLRIVWWSLPIAYAVAAVALINVQSGHPFDCAAALAFAGALLLLGWATVYELTSKS